MSKLKVQKKYKKSILEKAKIMCVIFAISFIISTCIENYKNSIFFDKVESTSIYKEYYMLAVDLEKNDDDYVTLSNDPLILFEQIPFRTNLIKIEFSKKLKNDMEIEVFYSKDGDMNAKNKKVISAKSGENDVEFFLPIMKNGYYRIDFGNEPDVEFSIKDIRGSIYRLKSFFIIFNILNILIYIFYRFMLNGKGNMNRILAYSVLLGGCHYLYMFNLGMKFGILRYIVAIVVTFALFDLELKFRKDQLSKVNSFLKRF